MSNVSILVADDNKELCDMIISHVNKQDGLQVVAEAQDGQEALQKINELNPDVVILDSIMPNLDGIGVLEKLNLSSKNGPACIIISAVTSDKVAQQAIDLGASYYMAKPLDLDSLVSRIRQTQGIVPKAAKPSRLSRTTSASTLEGKITEMLLEIGVPANLRGYRYIREAVTMCIDDMEILNHVTKRLYPSVAKLCDTVPTRVERAIRHSIEKAWNNDNAEALENIFGNTINTRKGKPTSSEFIALLSDKIRLELLEGK